VVAPKEGERFSFLDPKFEGLLFFESAEIDGRTPSKVFFGKGGLEGGRDFLFDIARMKTPRRDRKYFMVA